MALRYIILICLVPTFGFTKECTLQKEYSSSNQQLHLIELYTSEGCSSCPPAEAWINSLKDNPKLYSTFVPLAFHVSYWDYLGHKDPLANPSYNTRQRAYAKEWGNSNVYTPGFVKNGKEWRGRKEAPNQLGRDVGILKVIAKKDNEFTISFSKKGKFTLNGALLIHGVKHRIKRGENAGKILKHNFVVTDLKQQSFEGSATMKLTSPHKNYNEKSFVFWISSSDSLKPMQVVGACL